MWVKVETFNTSCTSMATDQQTIWSSRLHPVRITSILAIGAEWRRITQTDDIVDKHTSTEMERYQSRRNRMHSRNVADEVPINCHRLTRRQHSSSGVDAENWWFENIWQNIARQSRMCEKIIAISYCAIWMVWNDLEISLQFFLIGPKGRYTIVAKGHDWSATTENYIRRANCLVRNQLELEPLIASWFVQNDPEVSFSPFSI